LAVGGKITIKITIKITRLCLTRVYHHIIFRPRIMFHATTILCIRHNGKVAMAGDGQVTIGDIVVKQGARKIRKLYNERVLAGFAGSAADGMALFSKFESKLEEFRGNLKRASVELAKEWRTDRVLRRLEALLVVADPENSYLISGSGD
jgi:ATP-dependent HslUV protease subunit HslV